MIALDRAKRSSAGHGMIKDIPDMDNAKDVHQLLLDKAHELDLPKAFHRDLTEHDLTSLTEMPNGQKLLWGIGECGTHMIRLKPLESPAYYVNRMSGVTHWFVIVDGKIDAVEVTK